MSTPRIIVPVENELGEGAFWHPERAELLWVDIHRRELFACDADGVEPRRWDFPEAVSAMAWIDRDRILLASATALLRFDLASAEATPVWPLEAENVATRSNDGRADRSGNFWIGTMGWKAEEGAGSIWRVGAEGPRRYADGITVSNSICCAPDGRTLYWTDTPRRVIWKQALDAAGAPEGRPEPFAEVTDGFPDGATVDAEGHVWSARWDGFAVVRHRPDGTEERRIELPVARPTCPAFGGPDLTRLYVTTARTGLDAAALRAQPGAGALWAVDLDVPGLPEGRFAHLDGREPPA